jgi:capsular polysaccharide transport system permease protein
MATPLYATKTEFVIQQADGAGGAGLGGLFSGTQLATSQDSITVQSYLQSREAMLRLNKDEGFKAHFQQEAIDPIRRLEPDATNEAAFDLYRRMVKIGYDPSEGIIRMEVIAADPDLSRRFSESLISYAEEQVDQLTARLRDDQMEGANTSYADAEAKVFAAQAKVLELQEQVGILDPVSETNVVMGQISGFETQLQQKKLELGQLLDNPRPNEARVAGVRGDIQRLERLIADLRSQLTTKSGPAGESLAAVTGQLRIAEAELQTRQMLLSAAAQQLESARIEANKQVRYLEMGVRPVAPDEPTYPRAFENTLLAFLIFSGIYLMLSLTASILREQVSS